MIKLYQSQCLILFCLQTKYSPILIHRYKILVFCLHSWESTRNWTFVHHHYSPHWTINIQRKHLCQRISLQHFVEEALAQALELSSLIDNFQDHKIQLMMSYHNLILRELKMIYWISKLWKMYLLQAVYVFDQEMLIVWVSWHCITETMWLPGQKLETIYIARQC